MIAVPEKFLRDVIRNLDEVHPENVFSKRLSAKGGPLPPVTLTEGLASFLEQQIAELYDPRSTDNANIRRVLYSLERHQEMLGQVIERLKYIGDHRSH